MSDSKGLLDLSYFVRVQHTGLGQQTLGTGSRGTVVSSGNGLQSSRSPAPGTRDGKGAGGRETRVHQIRPRRGVGEKKWIREWRSRMEQRLAVGGKRVTTGRFSSVVVDLFYGQLKSKVTCKVCGHESVKFDPFSSLSLPLPVEATIALIRS